MYSLAAIFYVIAAQLDMLLVFTRGHYLIASAKRAPGVRGRRRVMMADDLERF